MIDFGVVTAGRILDLGKCDWLTWMQGSHAMRSMAEGFQTPGVGHARKAAAEDVLSGKGRL